MTTHILQRKKGNNSSDDPHDPYTEVWDGVTIVSPSANNEHSTLAGVLAGILFNVTDYQLGDRVGTVPNISNRQHGWEKNYRIPDLAVFLAASSAIDHGTHWESGPDFLVEIISPGVNPHSKLTFYEKILTREMLVVHRDPWMLELFQHDGTKLNLAGVSDIASSQMLTSSVLPVALQLVQGNNRPDIVVVHTQTQQQWRV